LIEVGSDCILGLGRKAILSPPLRAHLQDKNLLYLHQFYRPSKGGPLGDSWLSGSELQLELDLKVEWDDFTQLLKESGVRLQSKSDSLIWTGGDRSGQLTAKNVYQALAALTWKPLSSNWRQRIWRDICPLKLKLFAWLLLENKLLFWDKLQARGWEGPNRCSLCNHDSESTLHVFILCPFTRAIWSYISSALNFSSLWTGNNVQACFQNWFLNNSAQSMLPIHLCWQVWLSRNATIFNDKKPSFLYVSSLILAEANKVDKLYRSSLRIGFLFSFQSIGRWPGSTGPHNKGARFVELGGK
jgi:hypothetical protein